jgi:Brp/Blh family beta-carotene 15,15'-monooxygenase
LLLYTLLAAFVIALWLIAPLFSLIGFLLFSAFHFGKCDSEIYHGHARLFAIIAHGGLATIYLPFLHKDAAFAAFAALTLRQPDELAALEALLSFAGLIWLAALIAYGWMAFVNRFYRARFIEIIVVAIIMAFLPLLPAFALYFCAIHSRRHFIALYHSTKDKAPQALWPLALGLSCASWGAGAIALFWANMHQSFAVSAIQIIFIGLAALTVPHMILVDGLWRPYKKPISTASQGRS